MFCNQMDQTSSQRPLLGFNQNMKIQENYIKKRVKHTNNEFFYRLLDLLQEVLLEDILQNNYTLQSVMLFKMRFLKKLEIMFYLNTFSLILYQLEMLHFQLQLRRVLRESLYRNKRLQNTSLDLSKQNKKLKGKGLMLRVKQQQTEYLAHP